MHFFNEKYDYVKYNGKVKADKNSFETRRDRFMFHRLSKIDDLENHLVANILENRCMWVGDLLDEKAKKNYSEMIRRQQSMSYQFKQDLKKLDSIRQDIKSERGKHPKIIKLFRQGIISIETIVVLDSLMGLIAYWDGKINDDIIWPSIKLKLKKYSTFLQFDQQKYRSLLKEHINNGDD